MNSMGRKGNWRDSFFMRDETGRDLEGSCLIRLLRFSKGLRFFSFSTAWSRPRSRTGFRFPSNMVRM